MQSFLLTGFLFLALAGGQQAQAQLEDDDLLAGGPQTEATLIAESKDIQPGKPFTVALRLTLEKDWHVYWRNPGDSGSATHIAWQLPAGFKAGAIQWPSPHRFIAPGLVSYGYENEVWLLSQITPPANLTPGQPVTLAANVDWLICSEQCVPQKKILGLLLNVSKDAPTPDESYKAQFATARSLLPLPMSQTGFAVRADQPTTAKSKPAKASVNLRFAPAAKTSLTADQLKQLSFYPADESTLTHTAVQKVIKEGSSYRVPLLTSEYATEPLKRLRGVLIAPSDKANALARGIWIDVPITTSPAKP
ncbi:hypothetical protein IAD21_06161 [Abditibacteriota bacterium]|nr:hypothetical protein IAD21_06161 [Abditibacteriota bacterium]